MQKTRSDGSEIFYCDSCGRVVEIVRMSGLSVICPHCRSII